MQTIGERLEEARKRKGISVREAAETTKIRSDYLQKFEANSFDVNLPPLYIRGFVSAYARYLELDPQRIVSDLNTILNSEGKAGRRDNREVYGRVDFGDNTGSEGKANVPASRSSQEQALLLKFGLLGGGAIVAIIAIILLIKVLFPSAPVKITPPPAATIQAETAQTLTLTATEATREGRLALITPVITFTEGRCVAMMRWIPAARASWARRAILVSISAGATIMRSASSSIIATM